MQTLFFDSADGTRLRAGRWGDGPRDVLIVHGLAEHAERYAHVGAAWAARGWTVTAIELRGHGHSGGRRGHVDRWGQYIEDVRAVADTLRPGWCLFAHSMGGLVSLSAVLDGVKPAKFVVSNPLLGVRVDAPKLKIMAGKLLSRVWPTVSLTNELDPKMISRDPEVVKAYATDPLVYSTITPRWYTEMLAAQVRVNSATSLPVPTGFFLSDADPICDPVASERLAKATGSSIKLYPGLLHEIVNEIGKEAVIADIAAWLEAD